MIKQKYQPGALVNVRKRDWVVLPSPDSKLLILKPLGGSEDDTIGIYLPLGFKEDIPESTTFPLPDETSIGSFYSAGLLHNALRLSFRSGAGPFRSLGRISVRPRAYQIVPLIMALRQPAAGVSNFLPMEQGIRLLIADDVGVGKTIEALIIVKELLERKEIERFAVICLPHLCDQWQREMREKFGIDAVIIRSSTQAKLDRDIEGDVSVFEHYPYQIISIDYIKSERRRALFIHQCPGLIIVDEAHTCARPGGQNESQQQRHRLVRQIADKKGQGLILLTATPHSGKREEFQSLLGLLDRRFEELDLLACSEKERKDIARCFIQRRRKDVEVWQRKKGIENTVFPGRESKEVAYTLTGAYEKVYNHTYDLAMSMTQGMQKEGHTRRAHYWAALALLRGVMSSPAAGAAMVRRKGEKLGLLTSVPVDEGMPLFDDEDSNPVDDDYKSSIDDTVRTGIRSRLEWTGKEKNILATLAEELENLKELKSDAKAHTALKVLAEWLKQKFHPVVFCRYIDTAKYLGEILGPELTMLFPDLDVQVVTGEDPDEVRKERITGMGGSAQRLLIATDCLSEGINLQDYFTAVLHYDLPWNPNRLEQREGRVDRFGQTAPLVKTYLLFGKDNPIDRIVLKVLLRKVREIRKSTGISIPFPEDSRTLMDAVMQGVLSKGRFDREDMEQGLLDFGDRNEIEEKVLMVTGEYEKAAAREKESRSRFAQHAIKAQEIEEDLAATDDAIGDPESVERFVNDTCRYIFGAQLKAADRYEQSYTLYTEKLPAALKELLPHGKTVKISFYSPVPDGYIYTGRTHPFIAALCDMITAFALQGETSKVARASVIKTKDVSVKTVVLMFRVRNVIQDRARKRQLVAEEMLFHGYEGSIQNRKFLSRERVYELVEKTVPSSDFPASIRGEYLHRELKDIAGENELLDNLAEERAGILVEQHERFRRALVRKVSVPERYEIVYPVLPMDLMGIYILMPERGM